MAYTVGIALALTTFQAVPAGATALQWLNVFMIGFFLYGPQMLIGLCGAELVGPDSVGASEGFLGWIAYLGARRRCGGAVMAVRCAVCRVCIELLCRVGASARTRCCVCELAALQPHAALVLPPRAARAPAHSHFPGLLTRAPVIALLRSCSAQAPPTRASRCPSLSRSMAGLPTSTR